MLIYSTTELKSQNDFTKKQVISIEFQKDLQCNIYLLTTDLIQANIDFDDYEIFCLLNEAQ